MKEKLISETVKLKCTSRKYVVNVPFAVIIVWNVGKCIANQ
jgi:hypothetical protein